VERGGDEDERKIGGQDKMGDEEKKEREKRAGAEDVEWAEGDDDDL
jgi:hypothetical protein